MKRQGADYNDISSKDGFASASGIRQRVSEYRFEQAADFVPDEIKQHFINRLEQGDYFIADTSFEKTLLYVLKNLKAEDFSKIPDCNKELSHAFENSASVSKKYGAVFRKSANQKVYKGKTQKNYAFCTYGC